MREYSMHPLSSLLILVSDRIVANKDPGKPYVGLEHIPTNGSVVGLTATADASVSTNGVFSAGDILFGKLRPRLRKSVRASVSGYCSTDVLVLRPTAKADPMYAAFVAQSDAVFQAAIRTEEGTKMPRCSWHDLKNVHVYVPSSRASQSRVAAVLASVDSQIEVASALIIKYQQIKAGLMQDLFTRGVAADGKLRAPMQSAPALYHSTPCGNLPTDWCVASLGMLADVVSGITLGPQQVSGGVEVPYLRVANVQDGYLDLSDLKTLRVTRRTLEELRLRKGDVLMNEGGDFDKLGRGTVWLGQVEDCIHQNHVFRVRTDGAKLLPEFLAFYSESAFGKKYFVRSSKQSTNLASINATQLKAYPIPLPTIAEQQMIVDRLTAISSRIADLQGEARKLGDIKHGLMHDLLTGKVAVTVAEAAPEPAHA